jgi:shikimate kinase
VISLCGGLVANRKNFQLLQNRLFFLRLICPRQL